MVVFGMAVAMGGLFLGTSRGLAVPRLLGADGAIRTGSVRFLGAILAIAALASVAIVASAGQIADALDQLLETDAELIRDLLRLAVLFALLQLAAGQLAAFSLVRGQRFVPGVAPAFPTLFGALWLLSSPQSDVVSTLAVMCAGSLLQVAFIAVFLPRPITYVKAKLAGVGRLALMTAGTLALLSMLPIIERVLASTDGLGGAAHYDYAMKSLLAVQQLLVGGLALASLADWSSDQRLREITPSSLWTRVGIAFTALTFAGIVAAFLAPELVRFVFQRGEFTSADTKAVAGLLRLALPAFMAVGVSWVFSQAMLSTRRNTVSISIGLSRFVLRMVFVGVGTTVAGIEGLVIGVSVAECVALLLQGLAWFHLIPLPHRLVTLLQRREP